MIVGMLKGEIKKALIQLFEELTEDAEIALSADRDVHTGAKAVRIEYRKKL